VIYSFVQRFQKDLGLSAFSPHELCAALISTGPPILLAELVLAFLRLLFDGGLSSLETCPPPIGSSAAPLTLQQMPSSAQLLTRTNWQEVLRCVCWMVPELHESEACKRALMRLEESEASEVEAIHWVSLLSSLADVCLDTKRMQRLIKERHDVLLESQKEYREAQLAAQRDMNAELSAKLLELKNASVNGTASSNGNGSTNSNANANANGDASTNGNGANGNGVAQQPVSYFLAAVAPAVCASASNGAENGDDGDAEANETSEGGERKRKRTEATDKLIAAIETRDLTALKAAIEMAEKHGHQGEFSDGRLWCTDELRAARTMLTQEQQRQVRTANAAELESKMMKITRAHLAKVSAFNIREDVIGTDSLGRRYRKLGDDASRLWVEDSAGGGVSVGACGWGFHASSACVERLCGALREFHPHESELKRKLSQLLPSISSAMGGGALESSVDDEDVDMDPADMKMEQLREMLKRRGQRVTGRRAELEKRLQRTLEREVNTPSVAENRTSNSETPDTVTPGSQQKSKEEEEEEWRFEGHRFIGERVVRCFDVPALGVIQKWLPASGEDPELFHVLHDDGDEEDLEMVEATEAMMIYRTHPAALAYEKKKAETAAAAAIESARKSAWEWRTHGHELIGQMVALGKAERTISEQTDGAQKTSNGDAKGGEVKQIGHVTCWMPAGGKDRQVDVFRVVLLNGQCEELYESAVRKGVDAFKAIEQPREAVLMQLKQPQYENKLSRKTERVSSSHFGISAIVEDLVEFEGRVSAALEASSRDKGRLKDRCKSARKLYDVSWCLKQLESHLHALQKAPDVPERKPWRHEGSSYIGKQTRRFFPQGGGFVHSNGVLTGWLPAEGEEPALWHMQHEDGDEEDLEEFEVVWAIESFVESRTEPVEEEAAAAVKAAKEAEAEAAKEAAKEAKRAAREDGEDSDDSGDGRGKGDANAKAHEAHGDSERLWLSSECRERWQAALQEAKTSAAISLSLTALKVHSGRFAPLLRKCPKSSKRQLEEPSALADSWYHEGAFCSKRARTR